MKNSYLLAEALDLENAGLVSVPSNVVKPELTILVVTYNHGTYLEECLNSIANCEIPVEFEVLISDDDSSDETNCIIDKWRAHFGCRLGFLKGRRENNIFVADRPTGTFNWLSALHASRGKYISIIEGDDYYVSPSAMTSRLGVLKGEGVSAVWGRTGSESIASINGQRLVTTQDLMYESSGVATSGLMFKREELDAIDLIPFLGCMVQDVVLFHALLSKGRKGVIIEEVTSHYRLHGGSMWWASGGELKKREMLKVWLLLAGHYSWYSEHPDGEKCNRWVSSVLQLPDSSCWRDDVRIITQGLRGLWNRAKSRLR